MLTLEAAKVALQPVLVWTIGLVLYGVFTFKFYTYLARRNVLSLNLHRFNNASHPVMKMFFAVVLWLLEFALAFPIIVFFWFAVLAVILSILSTNTLVITALISCALVSAVRVTSYFSEDLAKDLAKMLPFAVLGVFLVDASILQLDATLSQLSLWTDMIDTFAYYLLFIVGLELVLRIMTAGRKRRNME